MHLVMILHIILIVYEKRVVLYLNNDTRTKKLHAEYSGRLLEMALFSLSLLTLAVMTDLPVYIQNLFSDEMRYRLEEPILHVFFSTPVEVNSVWSHYFGSWCRANVYRYHSVSSEASILININIWVIQTTISRANGIIFNFHVQLGGGDKHFPPQRGVGHIFRFWLGRTGEYIIFRLLRPPRFYWMVPNIPWPINYN